MAADIHKSGMGESRKNLVEEKQPQVFLPQALACDTLAHTLKHAQLTLMSLSGVFLKNDSLDLCREGVYRCLQWVRQAPTVTCPGCSYIFLHWPTRSDVQSRKQVPRPYLRLYTKNEKVLSKFEDWKLCLCAKRKQWSQKEAEVASWCGFAPIWKILSSGCYFYERILVRKIETLLWITHVHGFRSSKPLL